MPVRFGHVERPRARQVLQYVQDVPVFVVVGSDRSFDRETALHWLSGQARGVPCTHEECPWCPLPTRICTYLPVLAFSSANSGTWKEKVLPILEGMVDFMKESREGSIWEFVRRRYKNAPVRWQRYQNRTYSQPFAGFDVEESLWKIWGMYANAKRTADRIDAESPPLFNIVTDDRAAG